MLFSVGVLALLRILAISVQDSGDIEYRAVASAIADEERAHRVVLAGMGQGKPTEARELIAVRERWHGASGRTGSIRAARLAG